MGLDGSGVGVGVFIGSGGGMRRGWVYPPRPRSFLCTYVEKGAGRKVVTVGGGWGGRVLSRVPFEGVHLCLRSRRLAASPFSLVSLSFGAGKSLLCGWSPVLCGWAMLAFFFWLSFPFWCRSIWLFGCRHFVGYPHEGRGAVHVLPLPPHGTASAPK